MIIRRQRILLKKEQVDSIRPTILWQRLVVRFRDLLSNRRAVRYALVGSNILLLVIIAWFTLGSTYQGRPLGRQGVIAPNDESAIEPLDQLSSADIAASVALIVDLDEKRGVVQQADSVKAEQAIAPADTTVIAKPQIVATALKSRNDIKEYVVESGDTVSSIASKFGVTSDSILWSNDLRSNKVLPGLKLLVPPIGVSGIVYTVRSGDTVDNLAQRYRASREQIIAFNDLELTSLIVGDRILIPNGRQPAPAVSRPVFLANFGSNGYDRGFCTWYVANRRSETGRPLPSNLGNARTWDDRAIAMGVSVNKSPAVGDAVVTSQRGEGHVAFVEAINADGSIWVSEMNSRGQVSMTDPSPAGGWGRIDWKLIPAGTAAGHSYIH